MTLDDLLSFAIRRAQACTCWHGGQPSLWEFAEFGYDVASTNRIVKRIGISKGVLFKYFHDKETLFLYVSDVCLKHYADSIPVAPVTDVLEWMRTNESNRRLSHQGENHWRERFSSATSTAT